MKKSARTFSIGAQGNSMWPLLQNGDMIEYVQTPFRDIQLNDIILIFINNVFVTHRVIYKTKTICIIRGDNNATADSIVQKERILAKVVRFKRKGKWYGIQDVYLTQSALYLHEIQKFETVLQLHNISHVFLKGVLISLRYENTIPKRIYADCDVLVKRSDSKKIEKIFNMLGYKLQERAFPQPMRLRPRLEEGPEVSFVKSVSGIPVVFDVHFVPVFLMTQLGGMNVLYPSKLLTQLGELIIKRGERKKIKGFNYSLCSVSDQILYLTLHIFHHNFTDSIRYQLLDAVIRRGFYDWKKLAQTIKDYRLEGYVYGAFVLLKKYFKTPIPRSFLLTICPSRFALYVTHFKIRHVDIFSQDNRTKAGIERFILIFLLSPESFWKKTLLFLHPDIIRSIVKILRK